MATYKSIEEYRFKKKRKNFFKKLILILFIFSILIVLLNVLKIFKGSPLSDIIKNDLQNESTSFPYNMKNQQGLSLFSISNCIGVLTKSNVTIINENASEENKFNHGYTSPVTKAANKKVLTYDRGGKSFRVDTTKNNVGQKNTEGQIILAQLNSNGYVAVVTTHERYASVITVYNSSLEEIYKYSVVERISNICFAPDNNHVLISAIATTNGSFSTNLYELNINNSEDINKYSVNGVIPLDVSYSDNNNITIISNDKIATYNVKTKTQLDYSYDGGLILFHNSSSKETVVIDENYLNNNAKISVINSKGVKTHTYNIDDEAIDIYCDGSRIVILGKDFAYNFDMSLQLLNKFDLKKNYNKIVYNGNNLYIISTDGIEKKNIG